MAHQPITQAEHELLKALALLEQSPGMMFQRQSLKNKWCGATKGRQPDDFERAIDHLLEIGMLRENVRQTMIGFTMAGYDQTFLR
jgi:hypothetical protein